jgi:hypothetical protein
VDTIVFFILAPRFLKHDAAGARAKKCPRASINNIGKEAKAD